MTALQQRCADALNALGPKPPWWRPLKRAMWMRRDRALRLLAWADGVRAWQEMQSNWLAQQGQWQGLRVVKDEEVN